MSDTDALINLITEIHKDVKALDAKLVDHMKNETSELAAELSKLMGAAFPNGDPAGHKAAHEAWLHKTEANAIFWEKMRFELSRWGLLGFIGWVFIELWKSFLAGPK